MIDGLNERGDRNMEKIRVVLADDHTFFREGLKVLLENQPDMEVVGEAGSGMKALELANELEPSIIIMDITMPDLNGLQASGLILRSHPKIKIIILSMWEDVTYVKQAVDLGIRGYVVKQTAGRELIHAIRSVVAGEGYFSPSVTKVLLEKRDQPGEVSLTFREKEVLQLVAEGKTSKEISTALMMGIKTVERCRQQIMAKLDIHDVASLTRYAVAKGFVK